VYRKPGNIPEGKTTLSEEGYDFGITLTRVLVGEGDETDHAVDANGHHSSHYRCR